MELTLKFSKLKASINIKEVVKNLFDFNIGTVLTETINVDSTNESKAFLLLFNTIKKTNLELLKLYGQNELNNQTNSLSKASSFESEVIKFLQEEVIITKEFFEDITQFNPSYLRKSFLLFKNFSSHLQIAYPDEINFIYFNNFRRNLEEEFQENKENYKSLLEYFDNPIINENKKMYKQLEYYKELNKDFVEPLQPDIPECKETLKDLYVEPYFEIYRNNFSSKGNDISEFNKLQKEITVHDFLKKYYFKNKKHPDINENHNLIFVLGQPGQGKTSFCNKVVYDYIEDSYGLPDTPLFFIRIRDLVARDFIDNTFNEIKKFIKQDFNFLEDKCFLVLDGLDEAYMSGGLNDNDLRNLYDRLNKATHSNKDLKIILTSRFNYLKLSDSCIDRSLVIQLSPLDVFQIKEYSEKFKLFYPKNKLVGKIDQILSNEDYQHILELLQQAVLLYFIAISDIDIDEKDSRTIIYDKIFTSLAKRSWDKNGQLSYIKSDLKNSPEKYEKLLREYIRNIAFAIYQSPNLYITINQLLELEATTKFIKKCFDGSIELSQEKIKEISKYLLISFYFQESKNNNTSDTAIEFFHNSLWEYLTAEYMWEENKRLLLEKDSDGDYNIISNEKYFKLIDRLIGQKQLSETTKDNLTNIISNEKKEVNEIISTLSKPLFFKLLKDDFLLEYNKKDNKLSSMDKSVEIFELFWTFYYQSNLSTNKIIESEENLIRYLFNYSHSIRFDNYVKNIKFIGDGMLSTSFSADNFYENIEFSCYIDNSWFADCKFKDVTFNGGLGLTLFKDNLFENTSFENCDIYEYSHFENNIFRNCKFINVYVEDIQWLEKLNSKNTLDPKFLIDHKIEKVIEKNYKDKDIIKFIIRNSNSVF